MLFKPFHVWPIICDDTAIQKTVTRRMWDSKKAPRDRRAKAVAGRVHVAHLGMFSTRPFAEILIKDVRQEPLGDITEADARAEGGYTLEEYFFVLEAINKQPLDMDELIFRIEFEYRPGRQTALAGGVKTAYYLTRAEQVIYETAYWQHMAEVRKALLRRRP